MLKTADELLQDVNRRCEATLIVLKRAHMKDPLSADDYEAMFAYTQILINDLADVQTTYAKNDPPACRGLVAAMVLLAGDSRAILQMRDEMQKKAQTIN